MNFLGCRNKVDTIAGIWADLLAVDGAPFKDVFAHIVFAIIDSETYDIFKETYEGHVGIWQ